jgi:serralysin
MPDGSFASRLKQHGGLCSCPLCRSAAGFGPEETNDGTNVYVPGGNTKPVWTTDHIVQQLTRSGYTWGPVGQPQVITYSFYTSLSQFSAGYGFGELSGFSPFTATQQAAVVAAFQTWADCANVTFVYVADPTQAKICFANTTTGPSQAWGYYPGSLQESGDVWINPNQSSNFQLTPGGYGLLTLIHEIGHALGLSHPGDYDASTGPVTYSGSAVYFQDSRQYTDMSYFSASNTGASHTAYAASALLDDIAAAQYLYGPDMTTRTGDTVYGFKSTAGVDAFDFTKNTKPVVAIWDAGGYNTLDCSGYSVSQTIDLNEGAFSSIGGQTYNVAIAFGVDMQCAVGGSGNDTLIDNPLDDVLKGGLGSDKYVFGATWGNDTVQDQGNLNTLSFTADITRDSLVFTQSGSDMIVWRAGSADSITVVGYFNNSAAFQFMDVTGTFTPSISAEPPAPPVNSAPVVAGGATLSRTMLEDGAALALGIGAPTDADGDALTVQVNGLPSGGTVKTSAGVTVTNGQTLTVAQLTSLTFTPGANANGSIGGFSYSVSDGNGGAASQTVNLSITAVNDAPVVTAKAANAKLGFGKSIAASSLFTATDVDSAITTYQFYDPSGVGSFKLNGATAPASGGWVTVTASQLAGLTYVAGSKAASETIQIKVSDGSATSNTISVKISVARNVSSSSMFAAAPSNGSVDSWDDQPLALYQIASISNYGGAWSNDAERDRRRLTSLLACVG